MVGGPSAINQLLLEDLVDELHVDVMPVLLGAGVRLLDDHALADHKLEKLDVRTSARVPASGSVSRGSRRS
ncbi:MAG: dihydrofolate reductase family protein [Actinomycetota bacterium]|nr:dihydrofolate reductase family protein [Actinomycetota bacterium]